jgi:hypothetical protein
MALSPSASVQGHWVEFLLSPIDPLSIESHYFFAIFFLQKITEMQIGERTTEGPEKMTRWEMNESQSTS